MADVRIKLNECRAKLTSYTTMTMVGNNYYRCGTRAYYISVDDNILIDYTFVKKSEWKTD